MLGLVKNKMSSRLIINKIDGNFVQSKVIFLKSNNENNTQQPGPFGEGIFPEIGACQEIWNIGYVSPTPRNNGNLLINITFEENDLILNIDKCVYTIEDDETEMKNGRGKLGIDKICEKLSEKAFENKTDTQIPWKNSDTTVTIDDYSWDYRIKSIKNMNKKIGINKTVLDLIHSGGYTKLFETEHFKCNHCKMNLKSARRLKKHMKSHIESADRYRKRETFKLASNSCPVCYSNVMTIKQSDEYSTLFCNLCGNESLVVDNYQENEGPKLCHLCGKINENGQCDANH